MLAPDKKKAAIVILSRLKPEKEEAGEASDVELEDVATDLLKAIKNDSKEDVLLALKAFMLKIQHEDIEQDKLGE